MSVQTPSGRALSSIMERPEEQIGIIATVSADPILYGDDAEGGRWTFPVRIEGVNRTGGWQRADGNAMVKWETDGPSEVRYGDRRYFQGLVVDLPISERRHASMPYLLQVGPGDSQLLESGQGSPFLSWCYRLRRGCARTLSLGIEEQTVTTGLLHALMLGYRQELPRDLYQVFASSGTLHIFAISGLHVGIVAMLIAGLLRTAGLARNYWIYAMVPLLVIYVCCTGMKASAVRACVMALMYTSALAVKRRPDSVTALSLAAVAILMFQPSQLLDAGFIMSFTIVLGLVVLCPVFMAPARRFLARDSWAVSVERKPRLLARKAAFWAAGLVVTSAAAWISAAPLTACYFNLLSPVALLGNLVTIPMTTVIVLTGFLSLLLGSVWPLLAEVLNAANYFFTSVLLGCVFRLTDLPASHFHVRSPHWGTVAACYAVLAAFLFARRQRLAVVSVSLALLAGVSMGAWFGNREVSASFVGSGKTVAALIDLPGPSDVLVNPGPRYSASRMVKQMHENGTDRLSALILTQVDSEHAGAAVNLLKDIPVDEVWCPRYIGRSSVLAPLLAEAKRRGAEVLPLSAGDHGILRGEVCWEVLHPGRTNDYRRIADAAMIMRMTRGGVSLLFAGGSSASARQVILSNPLDAESSILIADEAERKDKWSAGWMGAVSPRLAVIGTGRYEEIRLHSKSIPEELRRRGVQVWRATDDEVLTVDLPERGSADLIAPR